MKRQANTLSAIISNFDIVEDAIEASANSAGSALEENEKVLDSIQGRINLFNNSLETMWNNLLDDGWIKLIVDGGTALVKLIDKFGALRTIVFGILTYYSVFKKEKIDFASILGIHDMDKGWTFGKEGATGWVSKKMFPNKQASIQQIEQDIDDITNTAETRLNQNIIEMQDGQLAFDFDVATPQQTSKYFEVFKNGADPKQTLHIDDIELFSRELDKLNNMDNAGVLSYMQSLGNLGEESGNTAQALAAYASTVTDGNYSAQAGVQYVNQHNASIKASGIAAKGAAIGHAALNAAISMGISILISWVISVVTKAINANKELAESVEEVISTYNNATKTLKDHKDTIESIEDDYVKLASGVDNLGKNINLSTEEYERYNEIVNKIAEMFPEMVTGYTDEGNAIIGLKGDVDALTEAYEKEAQAARNALTTSANDTFKNFKNNTTKDDFWTEQSKFDELAFFEDLINNGSSAVNDWLSKVGTMPVDNWLEGAGIDSTTWLSSPDTFNEEIDEYFAQIQARYNQLTTELESEVNPLSATLNAHLEDDVNYQALSDEGKSIAQAIISGFDTEFYARDEFEEWSDITTWIDTNVIQKLQNTGNMAEFNAAFNLQTQFNDGDVEVGKYISQIEEFLKLLEELGFDEEIVKTVRAIFDIDGYTTKQNSAMEILDAEGDKSVDTLSKKDLDIIDKNKTKWKEELEIDGKTEMSWDSLINKIEEAKAMAWEATIEFEKLSEQIDGIQDTYTALSDAVTQYNKDGYLTLDNLQALLSLEPEYLALLQMENGQLSINQSAMETMIQTKLAEAKATAVQSAITQLNALAAKTEAEAINESQTAAANAISNLGSYASALSGVTQQAIGAAGAVMAFNAAVQGAQANELVTQAEIDSIMSNLDTQIALIDSVGANLGTNFKGIVNPSSSSSSSKEEDDRLEKLQEKYERKISNLDNQQTYLENEIERLEAENKGVSKSYYEEQIKLEEKKMTLLQQERTELTKLLNSTAEGSDEWWEVSKALWEVEHSIQESTLRTIEFRESIAELYKTAFDELDEAYGNKDDLYSDRQAYIEKYMELLELQGKAKPASGYMGLIAEEEAKLANSMAELIGLRKVLAEGMASGKIEAGDERWIEMQDSIRDTEAAILDSKVAIEQYKEELKSLQVEAFDMVREAFSNRNDYYTNQQDYIEGYIDYLEATGVDATPEIYEKLIAIEKEKRANNVADLVSARAGLAKLEVAGYTAADEEWVDANNRIVELEKSIQDSDIAMAQWQKTIREMDFEKFDRFSERVNSLNEELSNVYKLVEDEDVAFDDGTWTKEGITALSMLYHQIENNEKMIAEYNEELAKLEKQYKSGEISESEYLERAEELKDNQWDLVHTNEDLKDSIIDINEARIDLVEEGINKEVDAMSELIDLKKEELEAERD